MEKITPKQLSTLSKEDFVKYVKRIVEERASHKSGLHISFPTDLRMKDEERYQSCSSHHLWTAFVNNSGTIVHVTNHQARFWTRITFNPSIKHLSEERMYKLVHEIVRPYMKGL